MTITVERAAIVPGGDDVRLAADIYRPSGRGRFPVVIMRTPYDRGLPQSFGFQVHALALAEAGYAVVVQDVRGRFASEGDFYPFRHEGEDGAATVEWAAAQPWSTGAVGLVGSSYCGYAQVLAARRGPPSLKAWFPAFSPLDARESWAYEGDAFCLGFNLSWSFGHIVPKDRRTADPAPLYAALDAWPDTVRLEPRVHEELLAAPGAYYTDWLRRQDDRAYWDQLSGRGAGASEAAAVVLGGWFDLFAKGSADLWAELRTGPARHRFVIGPWDHSALPLASNSGESEFGVAAAVDLARLQRAWLDCHLRGESEPDWPAARVFVTGWNRWEDLPDWPPPHQTEIWYLQPGGGLAPEPPHESELRFTVDADDPTPTIGGPLCCWKGRLPPGQFDQRAREARPDVLCFRSEVLTRELVLMGPVRAMIGSGTTGEGADVFLTLVDVDPDGRALNVAEGVRRHLDTDSEPTPFEIELGPVGHAFRPGHRVGLDVAAMSFPRFDRLPRQGRAERMLVLGPSRLVLPVAS